ncbi:Dyp-type peroxidase [Corynebacterium sp. 5QC2CO]|uniref:Dyp-type peroxidase n=1 Tax=Corynebacterium sp. 5QC2CO TaxID=2968468 RepID=UPI00211BE7B4|nr:Dyp-type peroxidase [Corynebacterium sp. 5QC2CO]MCQ9350755.1 Dyp-type peroxidase [Corynebacterium sp. 5QC2CO]
MTQAPNTSLKGAKIPFDGPVQSGVDQPGQAHLRLVAFDLKDGVDAADLKELFSSLTDVARRLTQGQDIEGYLEPEMVAATANLTITAGFGERIFDVLGKPERKPAGLHDIPSFQHDMLRPEWGQSDFALQLCGDDLVTVTAASRLLEKKAAPWARVKWFQKGFSYAWGSQPHGATPRNPLGQLDGTVNPSTPDEWSEQVWIDSKDKAINNSCVMVVRRIALDLNNWDELSTEERSIVIGRDFHTGAPLSGGNDEFDEEDMDAVDDQGEYLIHRQSHLALSREQDGQPDDALRRRAYAYEDQPGEPAFPFEGPNVGLVWVAFQKNPDNQFSAIQARLDRGDLLNEWNRHIGSAVYWIAPGTTPESYWGQELIEG